MWKKIIAIYPDLTDDDFIGENATIRLVDEGDGIVFIESWTNERPLPENFKIGK